MAKNQSYAELAMNDKELLAELFAALSGRVEANPYADDDSFADAIKSLPDGLRAMAVTHYLDVSLTLDNIGWHFLNFGAPGFVRETEAGLRRLGLDDMAEWFREAHQIVEPFLRDVTSGAIQSPGEEYIEWIEKSGNEPRIDTLSQLALDKSKGCSEDVGGSAIYESWVKYARSNPEHVFAAPEL